jgi:hypothetical protein
MRVLVVGPALAINCILAVTRTRIARQCQVAARLREIARTQHL